MSFLQTLMRCKPHKQVPQVASLKQVLNGFDLTLLGIGAIIGAGIFVLTGIVAATVAGPAVMVSYLIAAIACALSAFSYAELSSSLGGCGSAYGYTYVGLGELLAWLMGWVLLVEYGLSVTAVAVGWSGYMVGFFKAIGIHIPPALCLGPFEHGIINLPAILIILAVTGLLILGTKQSARFNNIAVVIKIACIVLFIAVASFHVDVKNWKNFAPFGVFGVFNGAALVFFAFIGFDAVSTAAEETINPQRNLPLGILASLAICTLAYVLVAALLTGIANYTTLNVSSPVANALLRLNERFFAGLMSVGIIAGLTTVVIVMFYGLSRIFLAIARDGLLPPGLAKIHPKTSTPALIIFLAGLVMAALAGFLPMKTLAELVNIGTLAAFTLVGISALVMRYTKPQLHRPFRVPLSPYLPVVGIGLNLYLMWTLPPITWFCFLAWIVIGLAVYFAYGRRHSALNKA